MTFRKDSLLFFSHLCMHCFMAVICIVLIPVDQFGLLPFLSLMFLVFAALSPIVHNEFVTVDNGGILCRKRGKVIWEYKWDNIVKLKRSSRYRMPSVEIVTDDNASAVVPYDFSVHYFQLGNAARKAIEQYCKLKENGLT